MSEPVTVLLPSPSRLLLSYASPAAGVLSLLHSSSIFISQTSASSLYSNPNSKHSSTHSYSTGSGRSQPKDGLELSRFVSHFEPLNYDRVRLLSEHRRAKRHYIEKRNKLLSQLDESNDHSHPQASHKISKRQASSLSENAAKSGREHDGHAHFVKLGDESVYSTIIDNNNNADNNNNVNNNRDNDEDDDGAVNASTVMEPLSNTSSSTTTNSVLSNAQNSSSTFSSSSSSSTVSPSSSTPGHAHQHEHLSEATPTSIITDDGPLRTTTPTSINGSLSFAESPTTANLRHNCPPPTGFDEDGVAVEDDDEKAKKSKKGKEHQEDVDDHEDKDVFHVSFSAHNRLFKLRLTPHTESVYAPDFEVHRAHDRSPINGTQPRQ